MDDHIVQLIGRGMQEGNTLSAQSGILTVAN